jgi:hypothetical protein
MEASYAFVEDYTPGPDVVAYRHAAGWYPAPEDALSLQGFLASRAPEGEHGQSFRYLSPTTDLMGWVCARAAGTTWAEAVDVPGVQPARGRGTVDREGIPRRRRAVRGAARPCSARAARGARGDGACLVDDPSTTATRVGAGDFAENMPGGRYRSYWYHPASSPRWSWASASTGMSTSAPGRRRGRVLLGRGRSRV